MTGYFFLFFSTSLFFIFFSIFDEGWLKSLVLQLLHVAIEEAKTPRLVVLPVCSTEKYDLFLFVIYCPTWKSSRIKVIRSHQVNSQHFILVGGGVWGGDLKTLDEWAHQEIKIHLYLSTSLLLLINFSPSFPPPSHLSPFLPDFLNTNFNRETFRWWYFDISDFR